MLHVKRCNVKHNSESVFRYFASAVNSNQSTKCNRKDLYAICSYWSLEKVLCVHLSKIFVWYTATGLYITLHNSPARLDGIHPVEIHLMGIRIIEVFFFFFFFKKIHENFVGTLETVRNREVSVPRSSTEFLTGVRKPIDTNNLLNCVFIFTF